MEAIHLLAFFLCILSIALPISASTSASNYTTYIKTACNSTTYPQICYTSCSPYASKIKNNPFKLATYAITCALSSARHTSTMVASLSKRKGLKPSDAAEIKDCIQEMKDCIYEVKQSLKQMAALGNNTSDMKFKMSNIKTWMSAAITDENTCMDGVDEHQVNPTVKSKIRDGILGVAKLTSNALSLVNQLPVPHRKRVNHWHPTLKYKA